MTKQSAKMRAIQSDHTIDAGRRDLQVMGGVKQLEGVDVQTSPSIAFANALDIMLSGVTLSPRLSYQS